MDDKPVSTVVVAVRAKDMSLIQLEFDYLNPVSPELHGFCTVSMALPPELKKILEDKGRRGAALTLSAKNDGEERVNG